MKFVLVVILAVGLQLHCAAHAKGKFGLLTCIGKRVSHAVTDTATAAVMFPVVCVLAGEGKPVETVGGLVFGVASEAVLIPVTAVTGLLAGNDDDRVCVGRFN